MSLPNAENAVVDIRKIRDYCLSPHHPRGRHKARVFEAALGLTAEDADELRDFILAAVLNGEAQPGKQDEYGQRFVVDVNMSREEHEATVRTSWIVLTGEDFPRLTSCYVLD